MSDKPDVYKRVTDKIIADLERGTPTWRQPWQAGHPAGPVSRPLRAEGKPYRGINVLMLWASAMEKGYGSPHVDDLPAGRRAGRPGAEGRDRIAGRLRRQRHQDRHQRQGRGRGEADPLHEGLHHLQRRADRRPSRPITMPPPSPPPTTSPGSTRRTRFFAATGATIRHGGSQAFYSPGQDLMQMPPMRASIPRKGITRRWRTSWPTGRATHHASTATSAASVSATPDTRWRSWSPRSARRYLCADLRITPETREDHAAYIGSWLKVLRDDKHAIFTAASHADRAADHLHGYQTQTADRPLTPSPVTATDSARRAQFEQRDPARSLDR